MSLAIYDCPTGCVFLENPDLYNTQKNENHEFTQKLVHSVHSLIIHNIQNIETTQMPINWWVDTQMWYSHKMEYYSTIKRNEVHTHIPSLSLSLPLSLSLSNMDEPSTRYA